MYDLPKPGLLRHQLLEFDAGRIGRAVIDDLDHHLVDTGEAPGNPTDGFADFFRLVLGGGGDDESHRMCIDYCGLIQDEKPERQLAEHCSRSAGVLSSLSLMTFWQGVTVS